MKHQEIGKEQLKADLIKMGIKKEMHLAVTLSLKRVGFVKGGPDAFIDALLEVVGPEGTLMMNAYTRLFPLSEINPSYIFDNKSTTPFTGLVPRTLMKRANSIRSQNPVTSVVAIGRFAEYLTDGNDENSENELLPYAKLAEIGGKYLAIGLEDNLVAIRHEAQRRAGLSIVPKYLGTLYKTKKGKNELYITRDGGCVRNLSQMTPELKARGILKSGRIGNADSVIASADKLIDAMTAMLKEDPTLILCDDVFCLYCRELEQRMNLYGRIPNPKIYQNNLLARKILRLRNRLVLYRYSHISFKTHNRKTPVSLIDFLEYLPSRFLMTFFKIFKKENDNSFKNRELFCSSTNS